jgi:hypothetical protein
MAWVTVRSEGESYLYSYPRSGTGTTGESPPVLPVPKDSTVTVTLLETLRENSLPVLPVFHRYHRSTIGTTGRTDSEKIHFAGKRLTGTTGLSPVPPVDNRYHRSTTDTTARTKTRRTKAQSSAGFMPTGTTGHTPVLPVLPGIKHFSKCP